MAAAREGAGGTGIGLQHVSRRFGTVQAVDDVSLDLPGGSFTALLGPSGCGKSTLLRLIAGFEAPDAGSIRFGERVVAEPGRQMPPERRGVGIVFQSYALFPNLTIEKNIAFGLENAKRPKAEINQPVPMRPGAGGTTLAARHRRRG